MASILRLALVACGLAAAGAAVASDPPAPVAAAATAPKTPVKAKSARSSSKAPEAVHWSYDGETGADHWAALSPDWAACATGHAQTPIDVNTRYAESIGLDDLVLHYHPGVPTAKNNGHTLQVDWPGGSAIEVDGEYFELLQFHLHTPSEHRLDGRAYPMELHLVHKDARGTLAVLGVFLEVGATPSALGPLFEASNLKEGQTRALPSVDPTALVPADPSVVRYSGSLTTPPCSEGVRWVVFRTPMQVSAEQVAAFQGLFPHNARPLQALRGRSILVDATP